MFGIETLKLRLEEIVLRNLKEEAAKLKDKVSNVKFVYLTSIYLAPMELEVVQVLCDEVCSSEKFTQLLSKLTDGLAIRPKLSCWPNGRMIDINLIYMSKERVINYC